MFEFHRPDPILIKFLGPQKPKAGAVYVRSPFTLLTRLGGKQYCYSTLTKQGLELPPALDPDGRWTAEELTADPDLAELLRGWFLKPADRDETKLYTNIASMMRAFHGGKGLASFVILPTMACNARCSYCYEEGYRPVRMDRETCERTLTYILQNRRPKTRLYLQWFGGEPLLGVDVIERILEGLRAEGVEYRCGFTTNGSLIDEALADKMAGSWNTNSVQITVDGTEESYRRIKRYVNCPDAYRRVLRAIGMLSERGIQTLVRINLDGTNGGEVAGILRDLSESVRSKDKVRVYLSPIYQQRMSKDCLAAWAEADALSPQIEAAGFPTVSLVGLDTRFRIFRCMAANPAANILITPEGRLSFCQHQLEGQLYGSVREGITDSDRVKALATPPPVTEKCRDCPFLPDCTAFQNCPVYDLDCLAMRRSRTLPQLHSLIEKALRKAAAEAPEHEPGEEPPENEPFDELLFHTE